MIAVIFDMDGLMLDTERVARIVWQRAAKDLDCPISDELYDSTLGRDERDTEIILCQAMGPAFSYPRLREHYLSCFREYVEKHGVDTKPGLIPLLDYLEKKGVRTAVATSTQRERAVLKLKMARVFDRFRHIVAGDEVAKGKPAPDIFLKAAEKMNALPADCFVLEDTEAGVQAAHAAGMTPICIPDLKQPSPEVARLASRVFPSLNEAKDHFESLLKG